jgi:hypothetical protein
MGARAFRIDDAEPELIRKFFEKLWNNGVSPIQNTKDARWHNEEAARLISMT